MEKMINKQLLSVGQDPKGHSDHEEILVGTPYGSYHKGSRKDWRTKLYFAIIPGST